MVFDFESIEVVEYFKESVSKIYLLNKHSGVVNKFYGHHLNPKGGECYFLTVLAVMGLQREDRRFCGIVDTIAKPNRQTVKDYKHSWVEYSFNNETFVYDPLVGCAIPQEMYYTKCNPRKVKSRRSQIEVIKPYINSHYAYRIASADWQFKAHSKDIIDENQEKNTCFIFSALQRGRLIGHFDGNDCEVVSFIASDPRIFKEEV